MRNLIWFVLFVFIQLSHFQAVFSQPSNRMEVLKAGDAVSIQVWQYEIVSTKSPVSNLGGEYVIDTKGYIFMPFVGLIQVANLTPDDAGNLIKQKYERFLSDPFIYIRPLIRVTLRGHVRRPGSYRVDPKSSFWDLMKSADGPLTEADLEKMYVERGGQKVIENLLQAFERAYSLSDVGVISGDQIVFPPKGRSFGIGTILRYGTQAATITLLYLRLKDKTN